MEIQTATLLVAQTPLLVALGLASFLNLRHTGKRITPPWLRWLAAGCAISFFCIWFAGWMFGVFEKYFGVTNSLSWVYWWAGMLLGRIFGGSYDKVVGEQSV